MASDAIEKIVQETAHEHERLALAPWTGSDKGWLCLDCGEFVEDVDLGPYVVYIAAAKGELGNVRR